MKMKRIVFILVALVGLAGGNAYASEKGDSNDRRHGYRLKSMTVYPSFDNSHTTFTFGYDSVGRLASERLVKVSNVKYDNYDITYTFEYPENELVTKVEGKEHKRLQLKDGNIPDNLIKYKKGRLVSEKFKSFFGSEYNLDGTDKCTFNWEGDDVTSISFFKKSQHLGDLTYRFREEKCNSPLIYAHTYGMIYVPTAFCYETLFNHVAMFHTGLPTPTRLLDSYAWPNGRKGTFTYELDSNGNPTKITFETIRGRNGQITLTEECQWEEY